ncbi:hypothetical protein FOZ60_002468 [Perkinsus olseni]|uniref:RRM domain-containing protein n=1 Tax=Perkinsus olseni TaxID=32597 RepID=A0A7J6NYZ9_PEROL|nr:hypothetical protein FOZ60_002468 [Perkinsus olseni]
MPLGDYQADGTRKGANVFHPEFSKEELAELHSVKVDCVGPETTEADVYDIFSRFGEVRDIYIPKEMDGFTNKPFCFVRYGREEEAQKAVAVRGAHLPGGRADVRAYLSTRHPIDKSVRPTSATSPRHQQQREPTQPSQPHYSRRPPTGPDDSSPMKARNGTQVRDERLGQPRDDECKPELFSVKVSCLAADTAPVELVRIFSVYGVVREVYIPEGAYYGFVRFGRESEAIAALAADQTTVLRGASHPMKVELSSHHRQQFRPLERRSYTAPASLSPQQQRRQADDNYDSYGTPVPPSDTLQQGRFSRPSYGDQRPANNTPRNGWSTSAAAAAAPPAERRPWRPNPARVEDLPSVDKETRDRLVSVKVDGLDEPGKYRQEVYELFSETGKVCEVYVPMARAFGSPHYMFVRYSTTEEAEASLSLNGRTVGGWPIRCSLAKRSFASPATPGPSMASGRAPPSSAPGGWSRRDPAPAPGWTEQEQQRGWRVSNPRRPAMPAEPMSRDDSRGSYRDDRYSSSTRNQGPPPPPANQQYRGHRPVLSAQDRERMFSVKVNNVGWDTTEAEIEEIFAQFGYITEIYHPRDKPFAFVRFETEEEAM